MPGPSSEVDSLYVTLKFREELGEAVRDIDDSVDDLERSFERGFGSAQSEIEDTTGEVAQLRRRLDSLDGKSVEIETEFDRDTFQRGALQAGGGGGGTTLDNARGGSLPGELDEVADTASFLTGKFQSLGLSSGGAIAALGTLAAGVTVAAGTVAGITGAAGGLAAAATLLATKFRDAAGQEVTESLQRLKAAAFAIGRDFTRQFRPVLEQQVIPFLERLAVEVEKIIPSLVEFGSRWIPSLISFLKGWVGIIPGILDTLDVLGRILDALVESVEVVVEFFTFGLLEALDGTVRIFQELATGVINLLDGLEQLIPGEQETPDWASLKQSVEAWDDSLEGGIDAVQAAGEESISSISESASGESDSTGEVSGGRFEEVFGDAEARAVGEVRKELQGIDQLMQDDIIPAGEGLTQKMDAVKKKMEEMAKAGKANTRAYDKLLGIFEKLNKKQKQITESQDKFKSNIQSIIDRGPGAPQAEAPEAAGPATGEQVDVPQRVTGTFGGPLAQQKKRMQKIRKEMKRIKKQLQGGFKSALQGAFQGATDTIGDLIVGLKSASSAAQAFKRTMLNALSSIISQLIQAAIKAAILKAVTGSISGGGSLIGGLFGGGGGGAVPALASGGVIESTGIAKVHKGEAVVNREMMRGGGMGFGSPRVNGARGSLEIPVTTLADGASQGARQRTSNGTAATLE